jgi:prepilin signal peptidase PulO-like enzyme (type II secretory pathway)
MVGSFLNVLALRSLKEESIIWPGSYCPQCKHALAPYDNIPVISYLILRGKCRYCQKGISWQYPFVELSTGLVYAALGYVFLVQIIPVMGFDPLGLPITQPQFETHDLFQGIVTGMEGMRNTHGVNYRGPTLDYVDMFLYKIGLFVGMMALASTLIAITITDFREKLIPHEITYPSMIFGIAFSAIVRGDLLGAMAGVGASYIIFDFMAFYGQKLYMATHAGDDEDESEEESDDDELNRTFDIRPPAAEEPVEVMGGGDAVLSAVMSAYLGFRLLAVALAIGFMSGAVMGLILLCGEMKKANLLKEGAMSSLKGALICGPILGGVMALLASVSGMPVGYVTSTGISTGLLGAIGGALIGMVRVGTRVSKPFPFGPALALGGFVAIFVIPFWLPYEPLMLQRNTTYLHLWNTTASLLHDLPMLM